MIDEYTRKCLTISSVRRIRSIQMIEQLANAMIDNVIPEYIRSDNGPEFIAKELRSWLSGIGVKTAPTLNPVAPGGMVFVRALTADSESTCLMERSSTVLKEPRSSLGSGSNITTMLGRIAH